MQTLPLQWRLATPADHDLLAGMMQAFYAEDQIVFEADAVRAGLRELLADQRNGEALLWLDEQGNVAGYAVMAMGFSLEQGGAFALLDELYLGPALRGRGRGRLALAIIEERARARGVGRMRLEVNHHNELAKRLYLKSGYVDDCRDLLTLSLDHEALA